MSNAQFFDADGRLVKFSDLTADEQRKQLKKTLFEALVIDGEPYKQWFLWRIAELLDITLDDLWGNAFTKPDEGKGPWQP